MNVKSIEKRLKALEDVATALYAGEFIQPTALGPNQLSKAAIKAKSITGSMIDVSNLAAVTAKTGNLNVDGALTIGSGGALRSGKTSYSDTSNAGYWIGIDGGFPKIRVGNIGHSSGWTWDGSQLAVTGNISATGGLIGGWVIGSTDLTSDSGATGIASSGSHRLWIGNSSPTNAPFRVTSAGAMHSTSGTIGGWQIDTFGLRVGSGSTQRGIDTGSIAFYAGSSAPNSAPFRVTNTGTVVMNDAIVTGGSLTIGSNFSVNNSGILTASGGTYTGTIIANNGVLSNLAITGTITVSNNFGAAIKSFGKTAYNDSVPGYWLGFSGTNSVFGIGDGVSYFRWNGSKATLKGRLEFGTGDYIDNDIIHFESSFAAAVIEFQSGSPISNYYGQVIGYGGTGSNIQISTHKPSAFGTGGDAYLTVNSSSTQGVAQLQTLLSNGLEAYVQVASSGSTGNVNVKLGDGSGTSSFRVVNSSSNRVFAIASNGSILTNQTSAGSTLGSVVGKLAVYSTATSSIVGYVALYNSIT